MADVDPITLEVIHHGVISIADQIDANITRTAFSPYVYEYKDFAVGLVNLDGHLIAQSTGGMPPFVADAVGTAVRDGLKIYGRDRLFDGDVVVCNHPAVQGQHLNNTVMYTPIYAGPGKATLIGFFAINVHWIDVGGRLVGTRDIFEEGLQLRSVKMWSKGEPVEDIYRIIEDNTRFPVDLMGDISAQLAGCFLGRDMTVSLAEKYGLPTFFSAVDTILDRGEAASRARILAIPDGIYRVETFLDNDGIGDTPVPINVAVHVHGDEITVDFSGIAKQVPGPINSGYFGGGVTAARVAFKYLVVPREPANEGVFRPLKVSLPDGTILSAHPTAPMGSYSMPLPTVIDATIGALGQAVPELATGGHFATHSGFRIYGKGRDGKPFNGHDSGHGGWGASAANDGAGPFRTMAHGDTRLIPMELQESILPFRIEELSLRGDSGGAGKFRGGLGFRKCYVILEPCFLQTNLDRTKFAPWGTAGGKEGKPGAVTVIRANGDTESMCKANGYALYPGDKVILETGGGGGYGPPEERSVERVRRDLDRGYISPEAAERDYGISSADVKK
ncbi:MAG: hydantoinase B/oxoprolinase family protein [Alphaproteobacteria bacterium]